MGKFYFVKAVSNDIRIFWSRQIEIALVFRLFFVEFCKRIFSRNQTNIFARNKNIYLLPFSWSGNVGVRVLSSLSGRTSLKLDGLDKNLSRDTKVQNNFRKKKGKQLKYLD